MKTREELINQIIEFFENNEDTFKECIEELDGWNGYLNDDRYYEMEMLNDFHNGVDPIELLYRAFYGHDEDNYTTDSSGNRTYGEFNPNREYFRYNGYGNLVSSDYKDYSHMLDNYLIKSLLEHKYNICCIEENEELNILFEELENMED